ncbi:MAG: bifunctional oligoribonuclease/PAP phosphatase NrnA [Nitrospirae bacterium]|nr:bifunctional oligoribonuclease/PAP phosphatase NrnA [Nitrospirota bacterium]
MKVPHNLISFLKKEDNFLITTHINPEPDAIGSSLALSKALESIGKKTVLYHKDGVPEIYTFLPGQETFIKKNKEIDNNNLSLILLDCNTLDRAGIENTVFKYSVVIDHHETDKNFGDIKWIEPYAAATGIMIFYLLKEMGIALTKDIATNLYAAIAIDTGTFRYSNTNAEVLRVAAELVEAGASPFIIANNLYETWSKQRFDLLIMSLNTLEIIDKIAFISVTKEMFQKTGTCPDDTENFTNFPRMLKDIHIAVLFRQEGDDLWKISLRSKGDINVAKIALHFHGGGHKNAAGYKIRGNLKSIKESLLQQIYSLKNKE